MENNSLLYLQVDAGYLNIVELNNYKVTKISQSALNESVLDVIYAAALEIKAQECILGLPAIYFEGELPEELLLGKYTLPTGVEICGFCDKIFVEKVKQTVFEAGVQSLDVVDTTRFLTQYALNVSLVVRQHDFCALFECDSSLNNLFYAEENSLSRILLQKSSNFVDEIEAVSRYKISLLDVDTTDYSDYTIFILKTLDWAIKGVPQPFCVNYKTEVQDNILSMETLEVPSTAGTKGKVKAMDVILTVLLILLLLGFAFATFSDSKLRKDLSDLQEKATEAQINNSAVDEIIEGTVGGDTNLTSTLAVIQRKFPVNELTEVNLENNQLSLVIKTKTSKDEVLENLPKGCDLLNESAGVYKVTYKEEE